MSDTWEDVHCPLLLLTLKFGMDTRKSSFVRSGGQHWNNQGICGLPTLGNFQDLTI